MAGRLYRMAKVVSANPASWGIVDANQISGFRTVATQADLYSIAACILSSSYGDGTTTGADAIGQIWHVQDTNKDFRLTSWASRGTSAGWTEELTSESLVGKINAAENKADSAINKANANTAAIAAVKSTADNNALKIKANADSISELKTAVGKKADSSRVDIIADGVNSNTGDIVDIKNKLAKKADLVNGKLDPEQLPDIDTTLYELAPNNTLPSTLADINKNHIYLVKAATAGTNNVYAEYIYTGTSATYDATKWEKLGEVSAKVDLSGYYTKTQTDSQINKHRLGTLGFIPATSGTDLQLKLAETQGTIIGNEPVTIPAVTSNLNGLMTPTMLSRLNSALVEAPSFDLATSGNESLLNIEATYNKKTYTVSLPNAGEGGVGLMTPDMYTKLENTSDNLSTLTTKVNGIKSFSVNDVVDGEQYSLLATDGTDAFNVGNISIRTASNGNTEIEAGGKKTEMNAIAAYARYDLSGNSIEGTYMKKTDVTAISNDTLTSILV